MDDENLKNLDPFLPIEVEDDLVERALAVIPQARDDADRLMEVAQLNDRAGVITVISSMVWYALAIAICVTMGGVALWALALYSGSVACVAIQRTLRSKESVDLDGWFLPARPSKWNVGHALLLAPYFIVGPVLYFLWYIDTWRAARIENAYLLTGPRQRKRLQCASQILNDDRIPVIELLREHMREYVRVIVVPNRMLAEARRGFRALEAAEVERVRQVRDYEEAVRRLMGFCEDLMRMEGPLGDENSCNRNGEDLIGDVASLREQLTERLRLVRDDPLRIAAQSEVHRALTDERERVRANAG